MYYKIYSSSMVYKAPYTLPVLGKVTEYVHSRYLRNHKSYKKYLINNIFIII